MPVDSLSVRTAGGAVATTPLTRVACQPIHHLLARNESRTAPGRVERGLHMSVRFSPSASATPSSRPLLFFVVLIVVGHSVKLLLFLLLLRVQLLRLGFFP